MGRPQRIEYAGAWYHVFNRGSRRQAVFHDGRDSAAFLTLLGEACGRYEAQVHAYCLMGNHYHLLVHTPEANLSGTMQWLLSMYTRLFNQRHGFDGPLFRGRYQALLVESDGHLLAVSRYIHRNPVDAGLTDCPSSYAHSSYGAYTGHADRPGWLRVDATLALVGGSRNAYQVMVEGPDRNPILPVRGSWAPILASASPDPLPAAS